MKETENIRTSGIGVDCRPGFVFSDRAVIVELGKIPKEVSNSEEIVVPVDIRHVKSTKTTIPFLRTICLIIPGLPLKGEAGQKAGWVVYVLVAILLSRPFPTVPT